LPFIRNTLLPRGREITVNGIGFVPILKLPSTKKSYPTKKHAKGMRRKYRNTSKRKNKRSKLNVRF
jgi:hypothetical protein